MKEIRTYTVYIVLGAFLAGAMIFDYEEVRSSSSCDLANWLVYQKCPFLVQNLKSEGITDQLFI